MSEYLNKLTATKAQYPFKRWSESGLDQYTEEACTKFARIFDTLIDRLTSLGEATSESDKLKSFHQAVVALNTLNETDDSLIETGEREDLCELSNVIAVAAGLNPENYGDGEGPASQWRDW